MTALFEQPLSQSGILLTLHHRTHPVLVILDAAEVAAPA